MKVRGMAVFKYCVCHSGSSGRTTRHGNMQDAVNPLSS
jgi:hypothetical protein